MILSNFDRQKVQLHIESKIGCVGPEDLKDKQTEFKGFSVTHSNKSILEDLLNQDAVCLYEKGIQSCLQGIEDLLHGYEAWAVVMNRPQFSGG